MSAVVTRGLTKRYAAATVVDGVDLTVRDGDRYGFLGPNGSGKTTTLRMLLGLVHPSGGEIEVLGHDVPRHAARALHDVGALVEGPAAYGHLSARANLVLLDAAGTGAPRRTRRARVDEALDRVGLSAVGRKPVKAFSLGMRQRLGLAAALLRAPRLLVLDEPTNGLDPQGMHEVRELLRELNEQHGTTVLLSSHLLAEVEHLCTRVGVVDGGRLVLEEELSVLRAPTGRVVVETADGDRAHALLDGRVEERDGQRLVVAAVDAAQLNADLVAGGVRVAALYPESRTLEQIVLARTGHGSDRVTRADVTGAGA